MLKYMLFNVDKRKETFLYEVLLRYTYVDYYRRLLSLQNRWLRNVKDKLLKYIYLTSCVLHVKLSVFSVCFPPLSSLFHHGLNCMDNVFEYYGLPANLILFLHTS